MVNKFRNWFERCFEEPFYRAEIKRAEILMEKRSGTMMVSLAGALSHNYDTMKSW